MTTPRLAVVIVAAGTGERLGESQPKAFVDVAGRTLLAHSLAPLAEITEPLLAVIVVSADRVDEAFVIASTELGSLSHVTFTLVPGGAERQASVSNGLQSISSHVAGSDVDTVLVHDAARAFTPVEVFERVLTHSRRTAAAVVPALPVVDTIKVVNDDDTVSETADRARLRAAQTPQGFPFTQLVQAYAAAGQDFTDDSALAAAAGIPVLVVDGSQLSRKVTTPSDLSWARHHAGQLRARSESPTQPELITDPEYRVGTGMDAHAFVADGSGPLQLACLSWPDEPALEGHSDGDVAAHALVDALLAAAGLGDIGTVFGTDDPAFSGASGEVFLREAMRRVTEAGWAPVNVTVQVVGNRPKLSSRREEAQYRLESLVHCAVSVSGTTSDGLGLSGEGRGIGAIATVLLRRTLPANRQ